MLHTVRVNSHFSKATTLGRRRAELEPKYYYNGISIMNGNRSGYYYEGSSSPQTQYVRPPWSSGTSGSRAEQNFNMGAVTTSRMGGNPFSNNFYQYLWASPSLASVRPTSSRFSHSSARGEIPAREVGSENMDLDDWSHLEDGRSSGAAPRNWEHTGVGMMLSSNSSTTFNDAFRFKLLSYNILAASLLEKNSQIYTHCDPANLGWNARLERIFDEIERYHPDILCLQEVEATQYSLTFEPRLEKLGYRGVFKKKTGDKDDGCAIFYRASKFLLMEKLEVEFMQPHIPLLNRDNVALLLKLETRDFGKRQKIVVGTTHLLFNPKRHDVRLAQAQILLAELDRFAFSGFNRDRKAVYHPVLMTGDFNCQPHSSVTKLFCDGQLQYLDENGDMIKWLNRRLSNSLLPSECGITDNCQHYKLVLERYKRWTLVRSNNFELELRLQEPLVDIYPYMNLRESPVPSDGTNSPYQTEIVSLYSPPNVEFVDPIPSRADAETAGTDFLVHAARKLAATVQSNVEARGGSLETIAQTEHLSRPVLAEMGKLGLTCNFGSGRLSHNFHFRDVYGGKLDRKVNEPGVTTKQSGWACVDYIFQGMTWNDSFNKVVEGKLKLVRRLGLPSRNQCKQLGDIPNREHPSDHFPLVAEFLLR